LKPLAPLDVRDFARGQGWVVVDDAYKDRLFVFNHPGFPLKQLVYPMNQDAPDYSEAIDRVVDRLAVQLDCKPDAIRARIESVRNDTLCMRILMDPGHGDNLPLEFALAVLQGAEQLLRASACTLIKPRLRHSRLSLTQARQVVDNCSFGQTERGSFYE
jgi:hypothetical protein